jgi:hypothetical protein
MEKLIYQDWHFEFFKNKLGTITCIAKKGKTEIIRDNFSWWPLINDIVAECDKVRT